MSDKEEKRPRLEKMVDASEYKKKENSLTRALSVFLPEDVYDLKDYIINGIVVPMIKDGLEDIGITAEHNRFKDEPSEVGCDENRYTEFSYWFVSRNTSNVN